MRKIWMIVAVLLVLCTTSCKKTRYCRCTAMQNNEVVELGDDFYVILDKTSCSDKAREFSGWNQVVCTEVSKEEATGEENKWWERFFNQGKE